MENFNKLFFITAILINSFSFGAEALLEKAFDTLTDRQKETIYEDIHPTVQRYYEADSCCGIGSSLTYHCCGGAALDPYKIIRRQAHRGVAVRHMEREFVYQTLVLMDPEFGFVNDTTTQTYLTDGLNPGWLRRIGQATADGVVAGTRATVNGVVASASWIHNTVKDAGGTDVVMDRAHAVTGTYKRVRDLTTGRARGGAGGGEKDE